MAKFKKTEKRSKTLLSWAKEDNKELKEIQKDLVTYIDNEDMSIILNSRINLIRESLSFYKENIVEHHLDFEEFKTYKNIFPTKEDKTVNYML